MNIEIIILLGLFLLINLSAFTVMLIDKVKSGINGASRISEGMIFFLASVFGSFGVYAGMFVFRHKTRKWYFLIGIPLLVLQNCAVVYLLYLFLVKRNEIANF